YRGDVLTISDSILFISLAVSDNFSTDHGADRSAFSFQSVEAGYMTFGQKLRLVALPCLLWINDHDIAVESQFKRTFSAVQPEDLRRIVIHNFCDQAGA